MQRPQPPKAEAVFYIASGTTLNLASRIQAPDQSPSQKPHPSGVNLSQGWRPPRPRAEVVCVDTNRKRPPEGDALAGASSVGKMVCCADVAVQRAGGDQIAAEAPSDPVRPLGRQRPRHIVHPVLPCRPVALAAPGLVMGFSARRCHLLPCSLEARPGLVERVGDTAAL